MKLGRKALAFCAVIVVGGCAQQQGEPSVAQDLLGPGDVATVDASVPQPHLP